MYHKFSMHLSTCVGEALHKLNTHQIEAFYQLFSKTYMSVTSRLL